MERTCSGKCRALFNGRKRICNWVSSVPAYVERMIVKHRREWLLMCRTTTVCWGAFPRRDPEAGESLGPRTRGTGARSQQLRQPRRRANSSAGKYYFLVVRLCRGREGARAFVRVRAEKAREQPTGSNCAHLTVVAVGSARDGH